MNDVSQVGQQMYKAGLRKRPDETPQQAAERIWKETKKDPVETIKRFEEWAREEPERILAILGAFWFRAVRQFLSRNNCQDGAWRYSDSFRTMWRRLEMKGHATDVWSRQQESPLDPGLKQGYSREYWRRKARGIKRVYADVDIKTGRLVGLTDKEFGPFAHIRVNGNSLAQVTTEEALRWCEKQDIDSRFVRALCGLIIDPREPIGEQWTPEIIRHATRIAGRIGDQ